MDNNTPTFTEELEDQFDVLAEELGIQCLPEEMLNHNNDVVIDALTRGNVLTKANWKLPTRLAAHPDMLDIFFSAFGGSVERAAEFEFGLSMGIFLKDQLKLEEPDA